MIPPRVQKRIELLYTDDTLHQNCIGAALTVYGISGDLEHYISPYEAYKYLNHMTEISKLLSGSILVFENIDVSELLEHSVVTHMAVVIDEKPLKIMHRAYSKGAEINKGKPEYFMNAPFIETTLEDLYKQYGDYTRLKIFS